MTSKNGQVSFHFGVEAVSVMDVCCLDVSDWHSAHRRGGGQSVVRRTHLCCKSSLLLSLSWCPPLVVPVVTGHLGNCYCHLFFVVSLLSSLFSHYVLYQHSPTPIICCCSPFSSLSFQISLNAVLSSSSPPFPSTFWAFVICLYVLLLTIS